METKEKKECFDYSSKCDSNNHQGSINKQNQLEIETMFTYMSSTVQIISVSSSSSTPI